MNARCLGELAPIPIAFGAGALAARALFTRLPSRFAGDALQPFPIVTAWGAFGSEAFALLAATIALATIALFSAIRRHPRAEPTADPTAIVVTVATVTLAAAFAWPFAFSSDVYAYGAYGAMLRAGIDPYALLSPNVHGPFYEAARRQWSGTYPVCVYGPLSVGVAVLAVSALGSHGVAATLLGLRVATAFAFLGSIALLARALRDRSPAFRRTALYAYGLNPVIIWSVAEGHNDAWLLVMVTGALALRRTRPGAGGLMLGLSLLFKAPGAAFALAAILDPRLRAGRARLRIVAPALAIGVALGAAIWLPLMRPAFAALGAHGRYAPSVSLQSSIGLVPSLLLALAAAGYGIHLLVARDRAGYAWLGIAISVGLPNGYPWYALWLVPFALAGMPGRAATALWAATITAVVRYLPDAAGQLDPTASRIAGLVAVAPLFYALSDLRAKKEPVKL